MICYRDMTFCAHWRDCDAAPNCPRPLTDAVKAAAERWWGNSGAPIATFVQRPDCHTAMLAAAKTAERRKLLDALEARDNADLASATREELLAKLAALD